MKKLLVFMMFLCFGAVPSFSQVFINVFNSELPPIVATTRLNYLTGYEITQLQYDNVIDVKALAQNGSGASLEIVFTLPTSDNPATYKREDLPFVSFQSNISGLTASYNNQTGGGSTFRQIVYDHGDVAQLAVDFLQFNDVSDVSKYSFIEYRFRSDIPTSGVPEPATIGLATAGGLVTFGFIRRTLRKKKF